MTTVAIATTIPEAWLVAIGILAFGAAVGTYVGYFFRPPETIRKLLEDDYE